MVTERQIQTEIQQLRAKHLTDTEIVVNLSRKYRVRRSDVEEIIWVMGYFENKDKFRKWYERKDEKLESIS